MRLRWRAAQFVEVLWWWFYLRRKDKAEYLRKKKIYWQKQLDDCTSVFNIKPGDTIIDMGCGPAGIYIMFPDMGVVAVDPLLDKYEEQLPLFSKADYPGVRFVTSPIETYNSSERFDYVFCMNAINHVNDIQAGFGKLAALANDNGTIIVSIDAHNNQLMKGIFRIGPGDILHPHQYDKKEYEAFLEKEGFSVVKSILLAKGAIFNHYILIAQRAKTL